MKRVLALVALAACRSGSGSVDGNPMPLGFAGRLPLCRAIGASGAVSLTPGGGVRAERLGRGDVDCGHDSHDPIVVRDPVRLAIGGPVYVAAGAQASYQVLAVDDQGGLMSVTGDDRIEWDSSAGSIGPGRCGDFPIVGCPQRDTATLHADAGTVVITVRYLGLSAGEPVTVSAPQ